MSRERFTVLQTISEGPVTTVYRAVQNGLGRTVLLKVLRRHLLGDTQLVERLQREAAACAALKSEYIVQVYSLEEYDGLPAIVMEFLEGESLKEYLERDGDRSERFARTVASAVLKGLGTAHARGVIHRDIKPANLMLAAGGSVRITDFGLASLGSSSSLTAEGVLIGTPAYMSPEQARGEALDRRTDLFALGITLVEILSGHQIFHGSSYSECINKILRFRVRDLDAVEFTASPAFRVFLRGLLAEDRERRFGSAEEALRSLEGSPAAVAAPSIPRRRLMLTAALALTVIVATLAWFATSWKDSSVDVTPPGGATPTSGDTAGFSSPALRDTARAALLVERPHRPSEKITQGLSRTAVDADRLPDERATSAPDSAEISVSCTPWGKVYLDGTYLGITPLAGNIKVAAGGHTLTIAHPHFEPVLRTITVPADTFLAIRADFLTDAGFILVTARPWAEIFIDDQYRETTPVGSAIIVSAGTRMVRLHHPSYTDRVLPVSVGRGDTVTVSHDFTAESYQ